MRPEYVQRSFAAGTDAVMSMLGECRAAPLPDIKRTAADYINYLREQRLLQPVEYNGNRFDTDDRSRSNVIGVALQIQAGGELPDSFTWRSTDNIDVPFAAADVIALGLLIGQSVQQTYAWSWAVKAQIDDAADIDQITDTLRRA